MRLLFPALAWMLSLPLLQAQTDTLASRFPKPSVNGYLSERTSLMVFGNPSDYLWDHELQNRLKFAWQPLEWLSFDVQMRNRFAFGESFRLSPDAAASYGKDRGMADLSFNLLSGKRYVMNSQIDRASLQFTFRHFELTAGRQRINWGQTLVWNPNDIFNTYSFFEFDYPERPGSDALRLQYFFGTAGRVEFAIKSDSANRITSAALVKWNFQNYDIQILAGTLNREDLVLGTGWAGNIGKTGFKGEVSYFHPCNDSSSSSDMALFSISLDYLFHNSWYILAEMLYRWEKHHAPEKTLMDYYYAPASVKDLAFTDLSILCQLTVPITPLVNLSLAAMGLPGKGFYLGPSVSLSLTNNLEASFVHQIFRARFSEYPGGLETTQSVWLNFFRLKWNF